MGFPRRKNHAIIHRQEIPGAAPTASGITGALTQADPNQGTAAPTLQLDTGVPDGGGFTTAPEIASGITPTITAPPTITPEPSTSQSPSPSVEAASTSASPIALSTVIASCVGAFVGAVALICLGLWFYRRYHRALKAQYGAKGRDPMNARADMQRRLSHREPWGKLEDRNPDDKWEGRTKTEESVGPMEKLTMFNKAPSVRTAYTHTEEEPVQFEMSHPFAQPYSMYNTGRENVSMPSPKPFTASNTWDDAGQGSFLSVRTQSERLSGSMSPSLNMAIPTPPATAPHHHWESAEIVNMEGQSAEIINPFADENKAGVHERRKSSGNPFFGAHEDIPRRRSRSNSLASKTSRASKVRSVSESTVSSVHVPVPKLDKGKGRAIDPFDDENAPASTPFSAPYPTITTSVPTVTASNATPTSPLVPPRPAFANHNASLSTSSSTSSEHAMASLIAALDGAATEEEVQARLRIASPAAFSPLDDVDV
ncbi:hypothetical protein NP233_g5685 [Leucocoprinus birnbaumii]|uniref:Uncharacterized protein n=1 Tax=Leucocoprinus birnbaumii TaxID=56174 RepID=A0AAD5VTN1_9AGAR|nr:hypothetical protein NP233_g5685 [Leucocoprinus birnbaumii]